MGLKDKYVSKQAYVQNSKIAAQNLFQHHVSKWFIDQQSAMKTY